ncbi:MAG: Phosphoglycolate phosphatase [Smithella sp. PtaU1.Bin162]|nr:MAG: Phosphoglycolate phosphatase [Smithella sp. PtaU1.Bin162]
MKEVDLIIFDFDGTLVSTGTDLAAAVNYTLVKLGCGRKQEEEIIGFVGDGVAKLIERALGVDALEHFPEAIKIFDNYYSEHLLDRTVLCPGAEEILKYFRNKTKVILTNKRYNYTQAISRGLGIEDYFLEIIGDGSMPYRKPDKRLMDYLLTKYSTEKERAVIIGDGINDIILAHKSGILSCACLNGLGKREDLLASRADFYCEDLREISSFFY